MTLTDIIKKHLNHEYEVTESSYVNGWTGEVIHNVTVEMGEGMARSISGTDRISVAAQMLASFGKEAPRD